MSRLAPNLFERRYDDLVGIGLAKLPSYAPAWTDYNAHDPGITLIELLAWVGEAQLYSLARTRRDERLAYAALMGIEPHGARAARGLIWPDPGDPSGPAAKIAKGTIIEAKTLVSLDRAQAPPFRTQVRQFWIPARIEGLKTMLADGTAVDQLPANQRGGPLFQPFGPDEGASAVLRMDLEAIAHAPLFEPGIPPDARLVIGVRADLGPGSNSATDAHGAGSPIEVTLVAGPDRVPLPVLEDSSEGMLRTGALVLDISGVGIAPMSATLEFRAPAGLERAPRLVRIGPNVVPIAQNEDGLTTYRATGEPDQTIDLETPGLEFEPGSDPVTVTLRKDGGAAETWSKAERLEDCGPADKTFELDTVAARLTFGNGVNGAVPPAGSTLSAIYSASEGRAGNIAGNRKWVVHGFPGVFGSNPDATLGGEDPSGWLEQRRDARLSIGDRHALVSAGDFEKAAVELAELEVGRAWMVPPSQSDLDTGGMRLVAMRTRTASGEKGAVPETARWLESVRQRLAPRVPLGSRLKVVAPRYVEFTISATVEAQPRKDPDVVKAGIIAEITRRMALVESLPGTQQRQFAVPVSRQDLVAWVLALPGVARVQQLSINVGGAVLEKVGVSATGLPRIDLDNSAIKVVRSSGGLA